MDPQKPSLQVRCPGCGGRSLYAPANPWRPFCSERCRNADLGAWASESYRVAARADPDDEADDSDGSSAAH
jgi:endogenous inhibitor of DNA gyrase (YacG/DUF329 family)